MLGSIMIEELSSVYRARFRSIGRCQKDCLRLFEEREYFEFIVGLSLMFFTTLLSFVGVWDVSSLEMIDRLMHFCATWFWHALQGRQLSVLTLFFGNT
jgi:hypothetical protein